MPSNSAARQRLYLLPLLVAGLVSCNHAHHASDPDPSEGQALRAPVPADAASELGRSVKIEKITLASGLVIEDLVSGSGDLCLPDARVLVRYTCRLENGVLADSSGDEAVELDLPRMIRGWQEGLPGMRVGGKRRLTVPAELGYRSRSVKDADGTEIIPPNSTLIYDIDLFALVPPGSRPASNAGQ